MNKNFKLFLNMLGRPFRHSSFVAILAFVIIFNIIGGFLGVSIITIVIQWTFLFLIYLYNAYEAYRFMKLKKKLNHEKENRNNH